LQARAGQFLDGVLATGDGQRRRHLPADHAVRGALPGRYFRPVRSLRPPARELGSVGVGEGFGGLETT
jgi:hypothetical protein